MLYSKALPYGKKTLENRCKVYHLLKYGFCNKSFWKDETLTSWTLLQHICPHFWAWLLLYSAITPKSEDKYVVKVLSEFHLSKMTCYKIHTLVCGVAGFCRPCFIPSGEPRWSMHIIYLWNKFGKKTQCVTLPSINSVVASIIMAVAVFHGH